MLARGYHVALVGGSDRHLVSPVGFSATWVKSETFDEAGIIEGIRSRHTFVSRSTVSATIEMTTEVNDTGYLQGDQAPVSEDDQEVTVSIRVTRAKGSRLFLVGGYHVVDDETLETAEPGVNLLDAVIDSTDYETEVEITVEPGDWGYPLVWDPLLPEGLDPELAARVPDIAASVSEIRDEDYSPLIMTLFPYIDDLTFMDPALCDFAQWGHVCRQWCGRLIPVCCFIRIHPCIYSQSSNSTVEICWYSTMALTISAGSGTRVIGSFSAVLESGHR